MTNLKKALEFERKKVNLITMPALGVFSAKFAEREAKATAELEDSRQDAIRNIPILEAEIKKLGGSIESPKPRHNYNGYPESENVNDGNGYGQ